MESLLFISILLFLAFLFGVGLWSQKRVKTEEDFIIAGRKFNTWLTVFSLFATWFGAGTLITATDEIRVQGLRAVSLEPLGAGLCLIIAGLFFAKPLWEMKIFTISDFYRERFGKKAEMVSVFLNIPAYAGWVAVQLLALSGLIHSFFGWPVITILLVIAVLSMLLTMVGGLWSVTITDSVQLVVIALGLFILAYNVFEKYGEGDILGGFFHLWINVDDEAKMIIPIHNPKELTLWASVLMASSLGNLSGQDLTQRIFAAKSSKVARNACLISGFAYISFGAIPVLLGIFSYQIIGEELSEGVIAYYAKHFLTPGVRIIFILCIFATVFSTITSAILSPASVIAHNYLKEKFPKVGVLNLCRLSVVLVTLLSVIVALLGENVYTLLEDSYALGVVCFFAPLFFGIYTKFYNEMACLVSMFVGVFIWGIQFFVSCEFPFVLVATLLSMLSYYLVHLYEERKCK